MFKRILLLFVAVLPVYLIGLYVYNKDKEKESKKLLIKLFLFGILSCIPAIILELGIGELFGSEESMGLMKLFFYSLISIALVEEVCKWFFTYIIAYNNSEFDYMYDAIVYTVFVSLGFALFENVFFVLKGGVAIAFFRAISAVPGHACFAVAMGNYIALARLAHFNNNKKLERKNLILSIAIPTILHGLYDYCLFTTNIFYLLIFLGVLIFIYIYGIRTIKRIANISDKLIFPLRIFNYCPKCGTKSVGKFCIKCGNNLSNNN